jgi:hypothetical protein
MGRMIVGGAGVLSMEVGIFAKLAVLRSKSKNCWARNMDNV